MMEWFNILMARLRALFRRESVLHDIEEELRIHVEMETETNIKRGAPPDEARAAALKSFGNLVRNTERSYDIRGGGWLEKLGHDLRYGARMLLKNPGFTLITLLTLALGIGANTAIFSVVDAVLLNRLPVKDPEQLVLLSHTGDPREGVDNFSNSYYERIREHSQVIAGLVAYYPVRLTVDVDGQPEPAINGQIVNGEYFQVLGVNALLGRILTPEDDREIGAHPVCVISHNYWRRRFARDPGVIGKTIHLGGYPFTVVGVTPPEFFGLEVGSSMDISAPLTMVEKVMAWGRRFSGSDHQDWIHLLGRLRPGVTMAQAQASLGLLYQQNNADFAALVAREGGGDEKSAAIVRKWLPRRLIVTSGSQGLSQLRRQFSQPLFVLMSAVALALLITCANVAGLLLARGMARRKELAVRQTLGAGRLRLMRQLFTESLLLSSLGSVFGLLLAWWGTQLLLPLLSQSEIPVYLNLNPNLRLLGFTAAVAGFTSVMSGLAPALLATRIDLQATLKQDTTAKSRRRDRPGFRQVLVIAQIALSLLLLVGAGLFVRSLQKLQQVETGYVRENVLVLSLEPIESERKTPRLAAFYDELLRRVKAMPGVAQASLVQFSPINRRERRVWSLEQQSLSSHYYYVEGRSLASEAAAPVNTMQVYPNSFATLGIPFVAGRDFGSQDVQESQTVAIINESMARLLFGHKNPLGQRVGWTYPGSSTVDCCPTEIIGVVKDARYLSLRQEGRPMFYRAFTQASSSGEMTLVVRTTGNAAPIAAAMQREAHALDPQMPRFAVETLAAQVDASLTEERLIAKLSSVFGLLALVLVCVGMYGALAYDVTRRTHEIGIRMALGARAGQIVQLVLRETLWLVSVGIVLGLGGALALTRLLKTLLFGVSATDPLTFIVIAAALIIVALLACWIPARQATKVDPMIALRCD
jgi:predicted permease